MTATNPANMTNSGDISKKGDYESTVLKELKDTIRKQAAEIDSLKKRLSTKPSTSTQNQAQPSVGHGGGGATEQDISTYLDRAFYQIAAKRVGWLGLFLMSLSLTALIMNGFEHTLAKHIELAYFVPLLAGHGGNTGGQSVGTVLSALSTGTITISNAPKVISKEALSGFTMGCVLASFLGPIAYYIMGIPLHVSTVVFFTMPVVSTIAATLGSSIPFACVALGFDPTVIAAPAMTSFVDVCGLMSYFLIANRIFEFLGLAL